MQDTSSCIYSMEGIYWSKKTKERLANEKCLEQYGYKVYSQNDEDGIIQEIFHRIGTVHKTFVEFGVQDGLESNCHYLLFQDWKGLWLEADADCVKKIQSIFYPVIRSGQLQCHQAFVTKDNVNALIGTKGKMTGEIDLLSIDIDGNDYYVWEAVDVVNPRVVVIEYNGKFPPDCEWKMAYYEDFCWDGSDWQGASLKAMELLGKKRGYQLVGTNLNGVNAFFVRKDLAAGRFFEPADAEALYNPLRLNIIHKNGHPARYCLKRQRAGIGMLNYLPGRIAFPAKGFHLQEGVEGNKFSWMSEKESQIIILNEQRFGEIEIPVMVTEEFLKEYHEYSLSVTFESGSCQEFIITECDVTCKVSMVQGLVSVVRIGLSVPFLWEPSKVMGSDDYRRLGIAVMFERIKGI